MVVFRRTFVLITACLWGLEATAAAQEQNVTVRYSKSEIAAAVNPTFIKTRDLSDVLKEKLVLIAQTLTQRQEGKNRVLLDIANESNQMTKKAYLDKLAVLHYEEKTSAGPDADRIRLHLLQNTKKSGEVKFKEAFPIIAKIQSGVNFTWSPGSKTLPFSEKKVAPPIHYGLVLQDIQPQAAPALASLSDTSDVFWQYSRPAHLTYTIDRVDLDSANRKVFPSSDAVPAVESSSPLRRVSTDVAVKIEAANSNEVVSDSVGSGGLPGAKISLSQADGLLSTEIVTDGKLKTQSTVYQSKVPLTKKSFVSGKWNESFKATETALVGVLPGERAATIGLYHLHIEKRYKAEIAMQKNQVNLGLAVEPRTSWQPDQRLGTTRDKITMTIASTF